MNTKAILPFVIAGVLSVPFMLRGQQPEPARGAYYSAQRPWMPPLPYHPLPDRPAVEVEPKRFVYDDTDVDYATMEAESSEPPVPGPGSGGGGTNTPPYIEPTVPIPGVPLLEIEIFDGAKLLSFNTITGLIYRLEHTLDLSAPVWTTLQEFVATSSNASFTLDDDQTMGFYRVFQDEDTIQFPDWFDEIHQFMEFTVYTPASGGTLAWELYADGQLVGSQSGTIPANGTVRVYDQNYNSADWPNTGYYWVGEWEFHVTVTPAAPPGTAAAGSTHKIVKKKGMQRNPADTYIGMLAAQGDIFNRNTTSQDDVDYSNWFCMSAMYNACEIVDWGFIYVDVPATDQSWMTAHQNIYDTNQWNPLRQWVTRQTPSNTLSGDYLDYFHYMGHGSPKQLGNRAGQLITLNQLKASPFLQTNHLTYAALDGCRTSKNTDFLKALVGYGSSVTRQALAAKGLNPHFGCGWDNTKDVEWVLQGTRIDEHFWFWEDFYAKLVERHPGTGLVIMSYEQAYAFAKEPQGDGVSHNLQTNPQANGLKMVGCANCRFDERPGSL